LTECVAIERVLLTVTQIDSYLTQLKEGVEETANSIKYVIKSLEELKDDSRNDVGKTKDQMQGCRQRSILKRVKEESDDGHQPLDYMRCRKKRARVIWEG
jgi:hypothetical protein